MNKIIFFLALAFSSACFANNEAAETIKISNSWARPTFGDVDATAIYMTIENISNIDEAIINLDSPQAYKTELHKIVTVDGISKMVPISKFVIPSATKVQLKPAGMHIMLMGLKENLKPGQEITIKVDFMKQGSKNFVIPVKNQ